MMTFGLIPHLVANLGEAARAVLEWLAAVGVSQALLSLHSHGRRSNRALA
jgi:hypothetical protein